MSSKYHYIGCFLQREELFARVDAISREHLFRMLPAPHATFVFCPDQVDESLFGEKIRVRATGYGNNGANEGLEVKLYSTNRTIAEMIDRIEIPHITLSVGKGAKPYDTRFLEFHPIEPFELEGVFGGYIEGGTVIINRERRDL